MGIRELREELASPTGWLGQGITMAETQAGRQTLLAEAAIEAGKQQRVDIRDMLSTRYTENQNTLREIVKALDTNPSDENLMAQYQAQLTNLRTTEAEWLKELNLTPQQALSSQSIVWPLVDELFKEGKHTWTGDTSLELIKRQTDKAGMPAMDALLAETLWKGRIATQGYEVKDGKKVTGETLYPGGGEGIGRKAAAEVLGLIPDVAGALINLPGALWGGAKTFWTGAPFEMPYRMYEPVGGREDWRQTFGLPPQGPTTQAEAEQLYGAGAKYGGSRKPHTFTGLLTDPSQATLGGTTITPTGESVKMGPFSVLDDMLKFKGRGGGMIDTAAQFMADTLIPEAAADTSVIGSQAKSELQAMDEEAAGVLTDEAIAFLQLLEQFIAQYGRERAIELLSEEWSELKDTDRRSVEKYLRQ